MKLNDISIGTRWGDLIISGEIKKEIIQTASGKQYKYWLPVTCRCGEQFYADRRTLCCGGVVSCGCSRRLDPMEYIGKKIGYLNILSFVGVIDNSSRYLCRCDGCNKEKIVILSRVMSRNNPSCGCKENSKRHPFTSTRIYHVWAGMLDRCRNPKSPGYYYYGGRGITVCTRWKKFSNFYEDMHTGYDDTLSLDRIDVNGNYEVNNCRWATKVQQARNTRTNRFVECNGERKLICEWAEVSGIPQDIIGGRIRIGWEIEKSIFYPVQTEPILNIIKNKKK